LTFPISCCICWTGSIQANWDAWWPSRDVPNALPTTAGDLKEKGVFSDPEFHKSQLF
jgi:hypothetical protein